ncbi:MAG: Adenine specific DNA methylase Mod [Parcubacteria group bacterium GW2011_GWF2_38_76]|nr:MAG: Adenine specific DNA methylase Mod [Parcubacteria group bacterium GW2011_GWF2_38_76]HBM46107.1 site-specific DNA-methyltransferase [Patescibacteria group bacterium]
MSNENEIKELQEEVKRLKKKLRNQEYGLIWEDKPEEVVEECKKKIPILEEDEDRRIETDPEKPMNLLIEGDNYHALSVLNYTHQGKISVIYIDPPYNTGAKDWKYNNDYVDENDGYRHSKWLSMMSNRLKLARKLLSDDGVLICAIDENEFNRVGLLLENIFSDHEQHCITIVHNPRGVQGSNFSYTHEYAFFSFHKGQKVIAHRKIKEEDIVWRNLRDNGGESLRTDARNCFYPIIVRDEKIIGFGEVVPQNEHPDKQILKKKDEFYIYPIDPKGIERKWRYARQSVDEIKDLLRVKKTKKGYEIELGKDYGTVRTVWQDSRYDSNENGTKLVHALVPSTHFDFPKSLYTVYDCIAPILYENKKAIVLDFFAGSGTTGHAVSILNKEDGGDRKFILCTNNENGIAQEVCYPRIKAVIKGNKAYSDITGISSNLKYLKTSFVDHENFSEDTDSMRIKLTHRAGEMIAMRENCHYEQKKNEDFQIFADSLKKKWMGIYFKEDKSKLSELVKILADKKEAVIYIFGWGKNEYKNEYPEYPNIRVEDIPEPILEVYKELNKLVS